MIGSSPHARGTHHLIFPDVRNVRFIPACAGNAPSKHPLTYLQTVHPRMRGERQKTPQCCRPKTGSSPHARGTLTGERPVRRKSRFIPACAGNAARCCGRRCCTAVHPRMRGERHGAPTARVEAGGSSPHARGTRALGGRAFLNQRFIPACAGNAVTGVVFMCCRPVHPRMRGERTRSFSQHPQDRGSSPHARGTRLQAIGDGVFMRFIPACAGNASPCCAGHRCPAVHPRMRGERAQRLLQTIDIVGSSPHARGTPLRKFDLSIIWRFIPACAGNARGLRSVPFWFPVHPRMRGERAIQEMHAGHGVGSSPHARGTQAIENDPDYGKRFIPACAGNATLYSSWNNLPSVHPRMRGERSFSRCSGASLDGSSPHARGTRCYRCNRQLHKRFIPACAGNAPV